MTNKKDTSFLDQIASLKTKAFIQKEEGGSVKPIEYKAVSFNIPQDLFWKFKEHTMREKSTAKILFNKAISDLLEGSSDFTLDKDRSLSDVQKYNIQINVDYVEPLKLLALKNRIKLTDIYIYILRSLI